MCSLAVDQKAERNVMIQTSKHLTANTPRKKKLRKLINYKNKIIHRLKNKKVLSAITLDQFLKYNGVVFPKQLYELIKTQVELHKPTSKSPRYSDSFKQMALIIYFMSPKVYRMFSSFMKLPSRRSLSRLTQNWPNNPGLNEVLFDALKFKTSTFSEADKCCSICIDEMSLKSHLFYNRTDDKIVGYDTVSENNKTKYGNNALVIMAQGIKKKWKQALGYFQPFQPFLALN